MKLVNEKRIIFNNKSYVGDFSQNRVMYWDKGNSVIVENLF